jgi:hypothetical protein
VISMAGSKRPAKDSKELKSGKHSVANRKGR